jgi:hypothetical protein
MNTPHVVLKTAPIGLLSETIDRFLFCVYPTMPTRVTMRSPDLTRRWLAASSATTRRQGRFADKYHRLRVPSFPFSHRGFETETIVRRS